MNIQTDLGYPRVVVMVWLDDGSCRQVELPGSQRKALMDTIVRMHNFDLKISEVKLPLKWPEPKPLDSNEQHSTLVHATDV